MTEVVNIKGMSCGHCVNAVKKALSGIDGISDIDVDIHKGQAVFQRTESVDMSLVKRKIEQAGYEVVQ